MGDPAATLEGATIFRDVRSCSSPVVDFEKATEFFLPRELPATQYPSVMHAWDNTPWSGVKGLVFQGSSPDRFRTAPKRAFDLTRHRAPGHRLVFLKSRNEWAEGNHLEPDLRDRCGYLEALKDETAREIAAHCRSGVRDAEFGEPALRPPQPASA